MVRSKSWLWLAVNFAALSACGKPRVDPPTSRSQACANALNPNITVGGLEFCSPGGAECDRMGSDFECRETNPGEQRVCIRSRNVPASSIEPIGLCAEGSTCYPFEWLQCRRFTANGTTAYGCFPGPPCSAAGDAGADQ